LVEVIHHTPDDGEGEVRGWRMTVVVIPSLPPPPPPNPSLLLRASGALDFTARIKPLSV
jgi:hypothetical protein